ncbi:hypothetical protein COV06_02310 [Candidatus Uhrbacteria bacterium CG10_big_fil_rev_8_21_14_0_10_50_16]|uniref:Glycerophosphoryl diester phosphodiesterase membrane domain-containing protein n=1 Tax=Candidatus Uhrbacteria bacterium CG10_big_fil_rev_8_21_14_0_10_50_16 TaxID=1975039 RepID=A0A2H0RNQ0_9BACT|nr:MAG: hypothetical protein COV06_02310 [Candidatus Uhrbacteria bacterium CG10_big_fil_rev_8_21_14_0_10_50_16]
MTTTQPTSAVPVGKLPKIGDILTVSIEAAKKHFAVYAKILLPYFGLILVIEILSVFDNAIIVFMTFIIMLASIAYAVWMGIMLTRISYQAVSTGSVSVEKAKVDLNNVIWPMIAVGLVSGIAVAAGTIFFIIPGIVLYLMFFSAQYLAVIDKKGVGDSLSLSIAMSKGRKWELFIKLFVSSLVVGIIVYVAVLIAGGVFLVIGNFVSEDVGTILSFVGVAAVTIPTMPVIINIPIMIFAHLKKLNGMS